MKFLYLVITFLLITFSSETTYALTDCEIENDSTTKTTAKITCTVVDATMNGFAFADNYLKINGNAEGNKTSSATLGGCTAAVSTTTCTITCTTVTGATAGKYYILTEIATDKAASSGVFTTTGQTGNGITLGKKDDSTKVYEGQASSDDPNSNTSNGNFLKYTSVYLLLFLF